MYVGPFIPKTQQNPAWMTLKLTESFDLSSISPTLLSSFFCYFFCKAPSPSALSPRWQRMTTRVKNHSNLWSPLLKVQFIFAESSFRWLAPPYQKLFQRPVKLVIIPNPVPGSKLFYMGAAISKEGPTLYMQVLSPCRDTDTIITFMTTYLLTTT